MHGRLCVSLSQRPSPVTCHGRAGLAIVRAWKLCLCRGWVTLMLAPFVSLSLLVLKAGSLLWSQRLLLTLLVARWQNDMTLSPGTG